MSGRDRIMTWAALLGKWSEFARSAVALPKDAEGQRWRGAVPPIIGLQAITHALGEVDELPAAERAAGVDRAAVTMRQHAAELHELWRGEPLPEALDELIADAQAAWESARYGGVEFSVSDGGRLVIGHPSALVSALLHAGFEGDLMLPTPGVPVFGPAPCAFVRGPKGGDPGEAVVEAVAEFLESQADEEEGGIEPPEAVPSARQVYRQFDFGSGRVVRDLVRRMDGELTAGQPLLVLAIDGGAEQPVTLPVRGAAAQERVNVEFAED